ncbi:TlpA family protein disulfide reductase [Natronospira bacteriovora]|uniref:Thioredoxin domain-containing protein n=1 Tax=Natronospira bacteriovora TaxID=3069753 RepID=A0ABU0W7M9_9GAMM|nr:hypothetical protein [Natronospira sp. AB-CW4]MDQ2069015.1 hypothetical protein [Natronospira sp. AB-CW4]
MKIRIALIAILVLLLGGWAVMTHESSAPITEASAPAQRLDRFTASADAEHPCIGTERCVLVYMAPWCPHCNGSIPLVRKVREQLNANDDTGMMVIVGPGGGSYAGHERMGRELGGEVFLDPEGEVWEGEFGHIDAVPAWAVFDGSGRMIRHFTGGTTRSDEEIVQAVLRDQLRLGRYFEF